ncbi:hypothetical protein ACJIZ3_006035 [Penstemon smallii]|uniref:TF-B3 domain-containing protein n=1 Tax=Penstemon smallii TaxID=265156 RepID=A0ABD3S6J9_9LAMI
MNSTKIPQQFIEQAKHEMRPNRKGIVLIRNRTYHCSITEKRGQLFIGGQGIKQLAKDFSLVAEDVFACWVCSGRSCMEKSFEQIRKPPISFFLEAGTYPYGLELPRRVREFIPGEGNSFVEVQTRFGIWKIKMRNGPYLCIMRGKCWESFCLAHNLSSVKLIQMEIHENGKFTAIIYSLDSNCEPPSMFTGKPLLLVLSSRQMDGTSHRFKESSSH